MSEEVTQPQSVKKRIVLDTDFGTDVDDALALALALSSPELEVVAITTVGRQSIYRALIVSEYLKRAKTDIPIYVGCDQPSVHGRFNWFGNEGKAFFKQPFQEDSAVEALKRLFKHNNDLTLVAIGPLTNIATAMKESPEIVEHIKELVVMGGHLNEVKCYDKVLPYGVDYNLCSDPEASFTVLTSAICKVTLVTADVTLQTWLTNSDLKNLEASKSSFLQLLCEDIKKWSEVQRRIFEFPEDADNVAYLHDPLTIGCVIDDTFCTFKELPIEVLLQRNFGDNSAICRTIEHPQPIHNTTRTIRCAVAVNALQFRSFFVQRLTSHFHQ